MTNPKNSQESEQTEFDNAQQSQPGESSQENGYAISQFGDKDNDTTGLRVRSISIKVSSGEWCHALALAGLRGCTSVSELGRLLIREEAERNNLGPVPVTPEARQKLLVRLLMRDEQRPTAKNGGK